MHKIRLFMIVFYKYLFYDISMIAMILQIETKQKFKLSYNAIKIELAF